MVKENQLTGVIDRLEEDKAILKFPDGQTLIVPIEFLPEETGEGNVISISFGEEKEDGEEREKLAKQMLNEILKKNS